MSLASIERITQLKAIDGADNILAGKVLDYWTVIRKGEFQNGDLCVWHNPDTICDSNNPVYKFLEKNNYRLKVVRLRGQVSQGLALPVSAFGWTNGTIDNVTVLTEGLDVSELVRIQKYEKPIPACLKGVMAGQFPGFLRKTDEPNLRSYRDIHYEILQRPYYVSIKIDGSSGTFYFKDGKFGVCSRTIELLESEDNAYWQIARKYKIEEALKNKGGNFALQGEVYGPGIQGNKLGVSDLRFAAFNLFNIDTLSYMSLNELNIFCYNSNLPKVDIISPPQIMTIESLVEFANELKYPTGGPAEGIVIRCALAGKKLISGKIISETFCLKYGE